MRQLNIGKLLCQYPILYKSCGRDDFCNVRGVCRTSHYVELFEILSLVNPNVNVKQMSLIFFVDGRSVWIRTDDGELLL